MMKAFVFSMALIVFCSSVFESNDDFNPQAKYTRLRFDAKNKWPVRALKCLLGHLSDPKQNYKKIYVWVPNPLESKESSSAYLLLKD